MLQIQKTDGRVPVSFTTDYYKRAVKQYYNGYTAELIALMEQAEIDSHTAGCLMGRFAGFGGNWKLTEFSDNSKDKEIRDFINSVFANLNLRELFEDIFDAKLKKFSVIELFWEVANGYQVIKSTRKHNQRYFHFEHTNSRVKINTGTNTQEIPEYSAIVPIYTRNPILLSVLRDYILKEYGLKNWLSFIETFGEAFIIGKYPPGADYKFKINMQEGINALGASSRGIFPQGSDIEIMESKRTTGDHDKFITNCDKGISITLLGHANAVENSKGMQLGNNLSAYQVKREIAISDILFIEEYINKIVRMLTERNFNTGNAPIFSIDKSRPINIQEKLNIISQAYEQGYTIHPDEYAKLGLYKYENQKPLSKFSEG